jgi:hypothetical protein
VPEDPANGLNHVRREQHHRLHADASSDGDRRRKGAARVRCSEGVTHQTTPRET